MKYEIGRNSDKEALLSFIKEILEEYQIDYDPDQLFSDLSNIEENYRGGWLCIAKQENLIVGSAALFPLSKSSCELRKMYLSPKVRGKGIGYHMFKMMEEKAQELKFKTIRLETSPKFVNAINLYERNGFTRLGETSACKGCDLIYEKQLN